MKNPSSCDHNITKNVTRSASIARVALTIPLMCFSSEYSHANELKKHFLRTPKLQDFLQLWCNEKITQGTHLHTILHSRKCSDFQGRKGLASKFYIMSPEWLHLHHSLRGGIFLKAQIGAILGEKWIPASTLLQTIDLDRRRTIDLYIPKAPPG